MRKDAQLARLRGTNRRPADQKIKIKALPLQASDRAMDRSQKINRKTFFKWAALALTIPFSKIWHSSVSQKQAFAKAEKSLTFDPNLSEGIYFYDRVILNKTADGILLFSSRCTHLGCNISKIENGSLVCPCHGSQFSFGGIPLKGPAVEPLETIDYQMEEDGESVRIYYRV